MKKIIIYSSLVVLIAAISWACSSSFLDETPRGFLSAGTLENQAGVEASLIGAYAMLDGYNINGVNTWTANPHNFMLGSIPSDDAYKGTEQTDFPELTQLEIYQWSAGNALLNDKWVGSYEGIVRVNNTLRLLDVATDLSEDDAKRIRGEALFLRAYYHFELYKVWGNVPYITEEVEEFIQPGLEAQQVLTNVIADLTAAKDLLPKTQSDRGRADYYAAIAFLGKAYMYGENKDEAQAITLLEEVVANKNLAPCLKDNFQTSTENNEEVLFAVQASINDGSNSANANWLNQLAHPAGPAFGCCGVHQPSQNLVNAYKVDGAGLPLIYTYDASDLDPDATKVAVAVDPRLDLTVGRDNVPFLDWGVHAPNWIRDRNFSGPYSSKKFIHYKSNPVSTGGWNNNALSGVNYPVIRLADVMLLLAEAHLTDGSPDYDRAEELVNAIRVRAGNCAQGPNVDGAGQPITGEGVIVNNIDAEAITWADYDVSPYPAGTFAANSGSSFPLDAVRFERRLEMALEGHRLFDLRRWNYDDPGYAAEVLNSFAAKAAQTRTYYQDAATYSDRHEWYPIPTIQINANTVNGEQVLKQNPGW